MTSSIIISLALSTAAQSEPAFSAELIFPLHPQHNHAPGIAELADGELLVSWYRGSGERSADDVAVYGSRLKKGSKAWSEPFLMVDTPGFPDCNTCLHVDEKSRLWLFWPVIIANSWESCLTHYKVSNHPGQGTGSPAWDQSGTILMKPDDFSDEMAAHLEELIKSLKSPLTLQETAGVAKIKARLGEKLYQRLGWQPRCKPTVLPTGRMLLPLYTDTYSMSIMAISDDDGKTWRAGKPMIGVGNIQPAVLRRGDGTLLAYMREAGPRDRIRVAESKDDGVSWGPVGVTDFPNPGSGLDGLRLKNGHWLLVYNDTTKGRHSLAVSISEDEGKTWPRTRHLERHESGAYHYPAVIQSRDGTIHVVYSYFVEGGKSMKHAAFDEEWVR